MAQDVIINGTTYPAVKSVALMGADGKAVQYYPDAASLAYATCDTVAATAAKVVTVSGNENWELKVGSVIMVYFSASNSASNVTLDVNGTGAYPIWYNNAEYTSTGTAYTGYAKRVIEYMFNGTHWVWMGASYDSNTTYKNVALGHGYATCSTAAATAAKVGTLSSYVLTVGGIVAVKFTNAVPANATLNINSKGAKNMFFRGAKITAGVIKAGDIATFIYDGTQYQLLSVDRWQNDVVALQNTLNGLSLGIHTDGLVYLFANGSPVGTGIELPSGGISGYVDSENNIVINNLPDGTYSVKYEMENGNTVNIGNLVLDSNVYYTVTKNLTNCTISNSATQATGGKSYSATITPKSGYELKSVTVTMGGSPVTVSGGNISIANVTGNIVITAVAEEQASQSVTQNLTLKKDIAIELSAGADRANTTGYCATEYIDLTNIPKPCTLHFTGAKWAHNADAGYVRFYVGDTDGAKLVAGTTVASYMPAGVTLVSNNSDMSDVTVTVTGTNIGKVRFVGLYGSGLGYTGSGDFESVKATLTYTPTEVATYTNQIPISTDASGNPYNGGQGWKTGYRLNSSGAEVALAGIEVTGFIPFKFNNTLYIKNIVDDGTHVTAFYDSSYTKLATVQFSSIFGGSCNGELMSKKIDGYVHTQVETAGDKIAFIRVSANEITANSIITVNEPIE